MPTEPAGGFQQGGWYGGQQYWNGTFSAPGVINVQSDQVGAGQAVSKEVVQQTNPANWDYIQQQQQQQQQNIQPVAQAVQSASTDFSQAGVSGAGVGVGVPTAEAPINLPDMYQNLYKDSGISDLESQYSTQEKSYIEAKGKINDNPFLSEATRVGRIAKIESLFAERTANIKGDIATQKADVETQMNLKLQQLDINSQQTQLAWQQLGSLLDMGALDNANGEDIANWTRQTGISSTMIKSAIAERNKPEPVQTSMVQSTNDAGEMTVSVINSQTGEVISQQSLGAIGKATKVTGGGSTTTSTKNAQQQFTSDAESTQGVSTDAGWVGIFPQLVAKYAAFMSLNDIYKLYLNSATGQKYGTPNESASEIKEIYDAYRGS